MSDYDDYDGKADADYGDYCTDKLLDEMEELHEENAALRAEVERLQQEIFQDQDERGRLLAEVELAQSESRKARKRVAELSAEVERLRDECRRIISEADTLLSHVDIDVDFRYYNGQVAAAKRILALQPLPAPPAKEE